MNTWKIREWLEEHGERSVWIGIAAFVVGMTALCWYKYAHLGYDGFDLAYFSQALWNFTHGRWFTVSLHPHLTLGDHAELILPFLAPAYALWPDPRTLLLLQSIAVAVPAWFVWRIAHRHLEASDLRWAAPLFALGWLVSPVVMNVALFEFHVLPFALVPLLWAVDEYDRDRFSWWLVASIAAMLVREDVALVVAAFGVLSWIDRRAWKWRLLPITVGAVWFIADMAIVSRFAPDGGYKFATYYGWLGTTPTEMMAFVAGNPMTVVRHVLSLANFEMVLGLFMVAAFLPIFALAPLILAALPLLQIVLSSSGGGQLVLETHYATLFLPAVAYAAIRGWRGAAAFAGRVMPRIGLEPVHACVAIAVTIMTCVVTFGPLGAAFDARRDVVDERTVVAAKIAVAAVGRDEPVIAGTRLLPWLANREGLYHFRYQFLGVTQFGTDSYAVPLDVSTVLIDGEEMWSAEAEYRGIGWAADHYEGGYARLRQVASRADLSVGPFVVYRRSSPQSEATRSIPTEVDRLADGVELLSRNASVSSGLLHVSTSWRATQVVNRDWSMRLMLLDESGETALEARLPFANGLVPTSELRIADVVSGEVNWPIVGMAPGHYRVLVGLERVAGEMHLNRFLSVWFNATSWQDGGEAEVGTVDIR